VEQRIIYPHQTFVFTLGYAGEHFNYYAQDTVFVPATFEDFMDRINGKKYLWCLITAWLPDIRLPHEDVESFSEPAEHMRIYEYVQEHFSLEKEYLTRLPTKVFFLGRDVTTGP